MPFTKEQPKDGFDGTRGEAAWLAACEQCLVRHGEKVTRFVRGDGTWTMES
jgi:hypothetical protein